MKILRLLLALLLLISSVFAMTNDERTWEAKKAVVSINTLMPDYFQSFNAQVDENNSMNIWFTCTAAKLEHCLTVVLGAIIQPVSLNQRQPEYLHRLKRGSTLCNVLHKSRVKRDLEKPEHG